MEKFVSTQNLGLRYNPIRSPPGMKTATFSDDTQPSDPIMYFWPLKACTETSQTRTNVMPETSRWLFIVLIFVLAGCQSDSGKSFSWLPNRPDFLSRNQETDAAAPESETMISERERTNSEPNSEPKSDQSAAVAAGRVDSQIQDGIRAIQEKRLDDASRQFHDVLSADADNATAHQGLAMIADLNRHWSESEYHYKQALRRNPRDAGLLNDLGYSYILQNRFSEADRYLNEALKVNPQHEKAQENLAMLALRQGDRAAAEHRLSQLYPIGTAKQHLARLEEGLKATESTNDIAAVGKANPVEPAFSGTAPAVKPGMSFEEVRLLAATERQAAELERQRKQMAGAQPEATQTRQPAPAIVQTESSAIAQQQERQQQQYPPQSPAAVTPVTAMPTSPIVSQPPRYSQVAHVSVGTDRESIAAPLKPAGQLMAIHPSGQTMQQGISVPQTDAAAQPGRVPFPLAGLNAGPGTLFSIPQTGNAQTISASPNPMTPPATPAIAQENQSPTVAPVFQSPPSPTDQAAYPGISSNLTPGQDFNSYYLSQQLVQQQQAAANALKSAGNTPSPGAAPPGYSAGAIELTPARALSEFEQQFQENQPPVTQSLQLMNRQSAPMNSAHAQY
jgi:Flp pilus assembly protein TadD